MSIALIEESAKEVRRLAIAGSPLAVGDFRLKKLIPPLEQAGTKVPVFAQVAKAMSELVSGPEAESAARLLNLSTLLNAILYTQGQSSAIGDLKPLEHFPTTCSSTRTTARGLKPILEALSSTGGGRFEVLKTAVERGAFHDVRLIDPAILALGDTYPELADLVAEKVLPAFGPGLVARLKIGFDIKGKRADARKLEVMYRLDARGTLELCKQALEDGSVDLRVAAIGCLGKQVECLPLVLEQTKAKNKQLRAAAFEALAEHDRPEVTQLFSELIMGQTLDLLIRPFRNLRSRVVLGALVEEGRRVLGAILKRDEEKIPRLWEILDCLEQRRETEVEEFFIQSIGNAAKLTVIKAAKNSTVAGADLVTRFAIWLARVSSPQSAEAVLAQREVLPAAAYPQVIESALRVWSSEKVFEEFAPLLSETKGAGKEKAEHLQRAIVAAHWADSSRFRPLMHVDADEPTDQVLRHHVWDARWLDAAVKADRASVVSCLARPNHQASLNYLLKLGEGKKSSDAGMLVRALARCQYPKVTDHFLELVTKKTQSAKHLDYELQVLLEAAHWLPPTDLPKLDAFAAQMDEKFVDAFLMAIDPLRRNDSSPSRS